MKTREQVLRKRRILANDLDTAEEEYTDFIGDAKMEKYYTRIMERLKVQIGMLNWVLGEGDTQ